jgi:hypothetical protein
MIYFATGVPDRNGAFGKDRMQQSFLRVVRPLPKLLRSISAVPLLVAPVILFAGVLHAQTIPSQPAATQQSSLVMQEPPAEKPSISLSPAVIMAKGSFGQGLTQTLTMSNQTGMDFVFELVAEDVIVKNRQRTYVPAGEAPGSIAATAVFSQKTVLVKANSAVSVDVHLTIPQKTDIRAVVAMFRGTDRLPTSSGSVGMTASLGTLITFNLSENVRLEPEAVRVAPATSSTNMTISQFIANQGSEPALPEGAAAILNQKGSLVGRATFAPQRLLPGERLEFTAEYPDQLQPGSYRVLCSFQFEGKTLTSAGDFQVGER